MDTASKKKFSYKNKLFLIVNIFFWMLVFVFVTIQYSREKEYKVELLDSRLQVYNTMLLHECETDGLPTAETVQRIVGDDNIRVTILRRNGDILFESHENRSIANHKDRPEIKTAVEKGHGYTIRRLSLVKNREFFYSADASEHYVVRTALPYDVVLTNILKGDVAYIWIILGVTVIINIILYFAISRITLGVKSLYDIAGKARDGKIMDYDMSTLPDDELGEVALAILNIYKDLQIRTEERDRSIQEAIFEEKEKMRIKHQLTSNINHELKTPVQAILGCFETLMGNNLNDEMKNKLLDTGYKNTMRLSALLQDVTLITRITDARSTLEVAKVNIFDVISGISDEVSQYSPDKQMRMHIDVDRSVEIIGNRQLVDAIFRNMINNSIAYSGGRDIFISMIAETDDEYKFDYYDNGTGIEAQHLPRIFERFYRVDSGRSRRSGGTGLGLSIVKNSVLFHGGKIEAMNHKYAGLEFVFTLKKQTNNK